MKNHVVLSGLSGVLLILPFYVYFISKNSNYFFIYLFMYWCIDVVGHRKTLIDSNYCLNETEAKPSKNGSVFSIDKKAEESHL